MARWIFPLVTKLTKGAWVVTSSKSIKWTNFPSIPINNSSKSWLWGSSGWEEIRVASSASTLKIWKSLFISIWLRQCFQPWETAGFDWLKIANPNQLKRPKADLLHRLSNGFIRKPSSYGQCKTTIKKLPSSILGKAVFRVYVQNIISKNLDLGRLGWDRCKFLFRSLSPFFLCLNTQILTSLQLLP